jgi:hypothetical protein
MTRGSHTAMKEVAEDSYKADSYTSGQWAGNE